MLVSRRARGLNDENIRASNVFPDLKIELAIRETLGAGLSHIAVQMRADLLRQRRMRISRKDFYVAGYAHRKFRVRASARSNAMNRAL